MTANELQKELILTECDQGRAIDRIYSPAHFHESDLPIRLLHSTIGMMNEVGEVTSHLQKWIWYGQRYEPAMLTARMKDEYADIGWHWLQGLTALGLEVEDVLASLLAKLKVRYPDKKWVADKAADENRDRIAEAAATTSVDNAVIVYDGHGFERVTKYTCTEAFRKVAEYDGPISAGLLSGTLSPTTTHEERWAAGIQVAANLVKRCEVCDWPLTLEGACKPGGDCGYRPDNPYEQRKLDERRRQLMNKQFAEQYGATAKKQVQCSHNNHTVLQLVSGTGYRCEDCGVTICIS